MPTVKDVPAGIKPYVFHGLDLDWEGRDEAAGECPMCGKSKLFINVASGLGQCKVCVFGSVKGGGFNPSSFVRQLWEVADAATKDYTELAAERGLMYPETLMQWGAARSPVTGEWLIPGYAADGRMVNLYRYVSVGGRRVLLATPGLPHGLHMTEPVPSSAGAVYVCEGPWDAMALWEAMRTSKIDPDGRPGELMATANPAASMLTGAAVVAVPGVSVMFDHWAPAFSGRRVVFMFDSDRPKENPPGSGRFHQAGWDGTRRGAAVMASWADRPSELWCLRWGAEGHDPTLPDGHDVRDSLKAAGPGPAERAPALAALLDKVGPVPDGWVVGRSAAAAARGSPRQVLLPCDSWKQLTNAWRKAMRWTEGLDRALAVMLASVASVETVGDQLWVKIIGPASCGKSRLCEAVSANKTYVTAKSTIRGFHSGFQTDKGGAEDHSLVHQLRDKTLITKDGDTLIQSPNLPQILAEARDVYDRVSRTHYRNATSRSYEGINLTWILCGTSSLRALDKSELGERFLDCVVVDCIDEDEEDEILDRVVRQAWRDMEQKANGSPESRESPEMTKARQLTGGYVGYLRQNCATLYARVAESEWALTRCAKLGKFVAHMRARPSAVQDEKAEREMAYRLAGQMVRLARGLAVVLNRDTVDEEVMTRVRRVAFDTSRGRPLRIVAHMSKYPDGLEVKHVAYALGDPDEKIKALMPFLRQIGVVESHATTTAGVTGRPKWRLTARFARLYHMVTDGFVEETV